MAGFAIPQFMFSYQGSPAAAGQVSVFQTGTTTPVTIYSDAGLTTPISNGAYPNGAALDSNGMIKFYYSGSVNLRMDAYTSTGTLIESVDPVYPVGSGAGLTTEATLTSATTTDLGTATSNIVDITGTTTITAFGSSANINNPLFFLRFTGILTLTYNATSLILPGTATITTAAGDTCVAQYMGSGNWKVLSYSPISGKPVVNSTAIAAVRRQTITTTGGVTYTPDAHLVYADVELWGAGGGGGGVSAVSGAAAAGGGAAGRTRKLIAAATIGVSQTVTLGVGGTAGSSAGGSGGTGGTSTFGAILTATGGVGGNGNTSASVTAMGGNGGIGSGGDDNDTGAVGEASLTANLAASDSGGNGAASSRGGNGQGLHASNGNNASANSGSGGGGSSSTGSAQTGGVGGSGYCTITEYCSQ